MKPAFASTAYNCHLASIYISYLNLKEQTRCRGDLQLPANSARFTMPPLAPVAASSALGAVIVIATVPDWPRVFGALSFAALFILQISVWGGWYMFIYPFYISPLRHLPTPPGALPLIGHSYSALAKGVGVSARHWYVSILKAKTAEDAGISMCL